MSSAAEQPILGFAVQRFNPPTGNWRNINDRILVRDYIQTGTDRSIAVAKARTEADRQVTGWSAAYPREEYRAIPLFEARF